MTGIELARRFYAEAVAPSLPAGLPHAAARLGSGSDVLGLDDATSRDHDWGLRLTLLVPQGAVAQVDALLERTLPESFAGSPVRFGTTWHPEARHQVEVSTVAGFGLSRLGLDPTRELESADWLSLTGQSVLEVVGGPVFADTDGTLTRVRERLAWYPDDVWRYAVATDWVRLGQELPFLGRAGERGDDLGSRVIAARLARVVMHLGFLLERSWPPYSKWFGTMFARLPRAGTAAPDLTRALAAADWREREAALALAIERTHGLQREVGLPTADAVIEPFWGRPFRGLGPVPELVRDSIRDDSVRALPHGIGSVEQWVDNVDVLVDPTRRRAVTAAWRDALAG